MVPTCVAEVTTDESHAIAATHCQRHVAGTRSTDHTCLSRSSPRESPMRGLLIHVRQHNFAQFAQRTLFLERAAKALNLQVEDVQKLISVGQLKLVDTFVTDRAFEEFCRRHGTAINMALIDASTRKWLVSEYGIPDHIEEKRLPRAQKHALIVRACKCGKKDSRQCFLQARKALPLSERHAGEASRKQGNISHTNSTL